jgi:hypothetical protein
VRGHHHAPGDGVGDVAALDLAHQVEAGVDARGGAGGGEDRVLVDIEDARFDLGLGVALGERGGVPPMGRAAPSVEQSRGAQDESADTYLHDPGATGHRLPQCLQQSGREVPGVEVVPHRDGDEIGFLQPVEPIGRADGEPGHRPHRRGFRGDESEVVRGQPLLAAVDPEYFAHDTEFERMDVVEQDRGYVLQYGNQCGSNAWSSGSPCAVAWPDRPAYSRHGP